MSRVGRRAGSVALTAVGRLTGRSLVSVPEDEEYVLVRKPSARAEPRWGHGRPFHPGLARVLAAHHDAFVDRLRLLERHAPDLSAISVEPRVETEPCWANPLFSGIDGAALYMFLRDREPRRYVEIGSGWSTRFAHRARRDGSLETHLTSIDPHPRVEIDALCDRVVRRPLEEVDLAIFDDMEAGDVVLLDGSHRVFMDNDVTTFWLDVIPRIPRGVLVGVHDILLPEDYHPANREEYWSEQYMLAVALLFGDDRIRPVLPCHYVCVEPALRRQFLALWDAAGLGAVNGYGTTFWFELELGS